MSHGWPCQTRMLGFCGVRSGFVVSASNQTMSAASSGDGRGPTTGLNASEPGRKSSPTLSPPDEAMSGWISASGPSCAVVRGGRAPGGGRGPTGAAGGGGGGVGGRRGEGGGAGGGRERAKGQL